MQLPDTITPLVRRSTKDLIYDEILDWIVENKLQPGDKLNDVELAKFFGVSRTPVREAIQLLKSQNLVDVVPGRFTVVKEINKDDMEKCYIPLAELQALGISLLKGKLTDEDFKALRKILYDFQDACEEENAKKANLKDFEFHEYLMKKTENEYIIEFTTTLIIHVNRIKYYYFQTPDVKNASIDEHLKVLELLQDENYYMASAKMKKHWMRVMEASLALLESMKKHPK